VLTVGAWLDYEAVMCCLWELGWTYEAVMCCLWELGWTYEAVKCCLWEFGWTYEATDFNFPHSYLDAK
jgi:hypothetical protein